MSRSRFSKKKSEEEDKIFKALSDRTRREILDILRDQPRTTGDVCGRFKDLDRCTVMLHLKILEDSDLVMVKREGRFRWNHLNIAPIHDIYRRWISQYSEPSAHLLSKLKDEVENG